MAPPVNDLKADATVLSGVTGSQAGTTVDATAEAGTVYASGGWNDVWYTFDSLDSGLVTFEISAGFGGITSGEIAVWSGTPGGAGLDYTNAPFLGRDTGGTPWSVTVSHPGGPLTVAVATQTNEATFTLDWQLDPVGYVEMIVEGEMEATPLVAAEAAYAEMIVEGVMSVTSPSKGRRPRAIVVAMDGTTICELPDAMIGSVSYQLNEPESWTITMLQNDPAVAFAAVPYQEVQVWRGDQLLAWGPCVRWAFDEGYWVGQYRGTMWYLTRRYIGQANRHNWVHNGSFESGLASWNLATNQVLIAYNYEGAQPTPPTAAEITEPKVEGKRAISAQNYVTQADAWIDQSFFFQVSPSDSPEGETWTLKGYLYLTQQLTAANLAWGSRGLYIERFSTTQLNPREDVQAVHPGAPLSIEVQHVPLDETTPVGVWNRFEIELMQPITGEAEIINVRLYAPAGVTVYWDAVSLTLIEKLAFYNTDQVLIAAGVVNHLQNASYDKSDLNISLDTPLSGIPRTRVYVHSEHPPGWRALTEFNELDDGFDFGIVYTPTDRVFTTYFPRRGAHKPQYPLRFEDDITTGNVAKWNFSFDGEGGSSSVIVLGNGSGSDREEGGALDASGWANGLTLEEVFSAPDETPIDSLGSMALERLRVTRNPYTLDVTLYPPQDGGLPDMIGNVWPGDDLDVDMLRNTLDIEGVWRVVQVDIDLEVQQMRLRLNPPVTT